MDLNGVELDSNSDDNKELNEFLGPTLNETPQEKYARLKRLESELHARQARLDEQTNSLSRFPNWPRFVPIIYVDLENEIPPSAQRCVKAAMFGVLFTVVAALVNIVAVCSVRGLKNYSMVTSVIFSLIQGFGVVYFCRDMAFFRLYNGCRNRDVPAVWQAIQFILVLWLFYLFAGFPNSGSAGLATFIDLVAKSNSTWGKVIAFVNTLLYSSSIAANVTALSLAHKYQRVSGVEINEPLNHPLD